MNDRLLAARTRVLPGLIPAILIVQLALSPAAGAHHGKCAQMSPGVQHKKDRITGTPGGGGQDYLYGNGGDDILVGWEGLDRLNGGDGSEDACFGDPDDLFIDCEYENVSD